MGFGMGATRTSSPRRKPAIIAANSRAGSITFVWMKSVVDNHLLCVRSIVLLTSSTLSRASGSVAHQLFQFADFSLMIASDLKVHRGGRKMTGHRVELLGDLSSPALRSVYPVR